MWTSRAPLQEQELSLLESRDGNVTVTLRDLTDFAIESEAGGGVTMNFPLDDVTVDEPTRIAGSVGEGTVEVRIRATNGSVVVNQG